ncbi:MAG TPA: dockerin type I repeat-containing protein, partial [Phycisphaerae bacterium]|nr:dockerin type I repeat-containing protein [Phycisphaerae bacterium]
FTTRYDRAGLSRIVRADQPPCTQVTLQSASVSLWPTTQHDTDGDGFLDQYDLDVRVDADTPGCAMPVVAKVKCAATAQQWWSHVFTVAGTGPADAMTMSLNYGEFSVISHTTLAFTAEIWTADRTTPLTPAVAASGGPIRAEQGLLPTHLTVFGRVQYKLPDGTLHPVRCAEMDVCASTGKVLANRRTNLQGEYSVDFGISRPNSLFIQVRTVGSPGLYPLASSSIGTVKGPGGEPYAVNSETRTDYIGSRLQLDLVINSDAASAPFHVFDSIVEAYDRAWAWLGCTSLREVIAVWPDPAAATWFDGSTLRVISQGCWDRDVIMAEYGRYIGQQIGFDRAPAGRVPWEGDLRTVPHQHTALEAAQMAFSAGWAAFFAVASQYAATQDPCLDATEGTPFSFNLETDTAKHLTPGEYRAAMVACTLWDLFDDHDDAADNADAFCVPIGSIWDVLSSAKPGTMEEFWNAWTAAHNWKAQAWRVFRDHQMSFLPAGCTIRIIANTAPASFTLTDEHSQPIGGAAPATLADVPPGRYTISWSAPGCQTAPIDSTLDVAAGGAITFCGAFVPGDCDPPAPNAFESVAAAGPAAIAATSAPAADASPPVEYRIQGEFFDGEYWLTTAGGASAYDWSAVRPDGWLSAGLLENGLYRLSQQVRDSAAPANVSSPALSEPIAMALSPPADDALSISSVTAAGSVVSVLPPPMPSGPGQTAAFFDLITGEGAGTDAADRPWAAGWSVQYRGLQPDTEYGWKVRYRGCTGIATDWNPAEKRIRTLANVPGAPAAGRICGTGIELGLNAASNPATTLFAIKCTGTSPADASYDQQWMNECGKPAPQGVWRSAAEWASVAAAGLKALTTYRFAASAKNAAGQQTPLGPELAVRTSALGDANGDCRVNVLDLIMIRTCLNKETCSGGALTDVNNDGKVNVLDLIMCRTQLNKACP